MKLPIDLIPNTDPPKFRWTQTVSTFTYDAVQECEGMLPPSCERAVEELIKIAKEAMRDNAMLRGQLDGMQQRVAAAAPLKPQATSHNKR